MKNRVFYMLMIVMLISLFINKLSACCCYESESKYQMPFTKITDDKHYIKPGSIVFSEDGLFLLMQGYLIPINGLETDADGVFISPRNYKLKPCPGCRLPLAPGGYCINPRCYLSPLYDPDYA